jgi:integrase
VSTRCPQNRVRSIARAPTLLKIVQARRGHASIQMTADRYGHLFLRGDDGADWPQPRARSCAGEASVCS